jgi:hypothetical protein
MLHLWLIPALVLLIVLVGVFYFALRSKGGTGVRIDGRIVLDKPEPEEDMPPS